MIAVSMAGPFGKGDVMVNFSKIGHGHRFFLRLSVPHNLGYLTQVTTYVAVFGEMAEGDRAVFAVAMLGDFARDLFVG